VLHLNGASQLIEKQLVSLGTLNQSLVHPREVFRQAIINSAAGIIVVHNHPSGALEPSAEDKQITKRLKECGVLIGIELLDHIIISKNGHTSLREMGVIQGG
jgi:DNA repair protein RadC